ncbi:hypothetical protein NDR87_25810 [Nocardia sp. CDC159]|uniref:SH3 domain-containing protein n=1 Tax=Nocardia pulmonis TaxID=2951408 RepID=A0A9X2IWE5_9NOCA|nr:MULTISPECIES: hypothetical protein [Nocardia]MCM6774862.1 hypothetical protein [Nocardia pulmonis]MCM6789793.1 hypothetical protein [Nocardia sp. CDC159]
MMRKFLAIAALAAGAALAVAPAAQADPNTDPANYTLRTELFVVYTDPAALQAKENGKEVIVSPYGTSRPIACHDVPEGAPLDDCWQRDDFGWFRLQKQELPQIGTAWVHIV